MTQKEILEQLENIKNLMELGIFKNHLEFETNMYNEDMLEGIDKAISILK